MADTNARLRAWSRFLGASALVQRDIERRLKAAGEPSMAWYDVLLELERAGGRLRLHELSDRLVIERYNVTRLLDRMEAGGEILREPASGDRRGMVASITSTGRDRRAAMWPHYRAAIEAAFAAPLDEEDITTLVGIMEKLIVHQRA